MAEDGGTKADKERWERECLDFLRDQLNRVPADPAGAVAAFMIESGDFAPYDLIEASKKDHNAVEALQHVVRWLKENDAITLLASPLLDWAVDVADGTWVAQKRKRGRPSKGHPLFRDYIIVAVVREIADIGLRPASSNKPWDQWSSPLSSAPSACHMVAAELALDGSSVRNIWNRYRQARK